LGKWITCELGVAVADPLEVVVVIPLLTAHVHLLRASRIRKRTPVGPYRRPMPSRGVLGGRVRFLMNEVPL